MSSSKFFSFFLLLVAICAPVASATDRITTTITFTNNPADGNTFTFNGAARTFKNTVATPATQIAIGASFAGTATNFYLQVSAYPYGGGVVVSQTATNVVQLLGAVGQAITASMAGTWGTITYSTQAVAVANTIRVPFSAEPTASVRTNNASQLVSDINTYSTTALSDTAPATANLVNKAQAQTITGNKTFNGNLNTFTNASMELYLSDISLFTNSILYLASGAYMQFEDNVSILDALGNTRWAFSTVEGTNKVATLIDITNRLTGFKAAANTWSAGQTFNGNNTFSGTQTLSGSANISGGYLNGTGGTNNALTNATSRGTHTFTAAVQFTRVNNTSLANGNNAGIDFGSETVFVKIKAGPTGAFTINGIAGGANGRMLKIYNATGQNMTIAYDSGVDATPANRIITMTGADVTGTGNSAAEFVYDSDSSRWVLMRHEP